MVMSHVFGLFAMDRPKLATGQMSSAVNTSCATTVRNGWTMHAPGERDDAAHSGAPRAHRIAVETEHLSGLRVRVDVSLDMLKVGLRDRHVFGQFQAVGLAAVLAVVN